MKTTCFFVLCVACVMPISSLAVDNQKGNEDSIMGTFTQWWSPQMQDSPKEVRSEPHQILPNLGGNTQELEPKVPEEAAWTLLDKLKTFPEYASPGKHLPESNIVNNLGDLTAKAREDAKQRARQELCELIKTCVKSMFWG